MYISEPKEPKVNPRTLRPLPTRTHIQRVFTMDKAEKGKQEREGGGGCTAGRRQEVGWKEHRRMATKRSNKGALAVK